jgi:hypothetical protein
MTVDPLRQAAADVMTMGVSVLDITTRLHKETPPNEIKHRQGPGGKSLAYVDARYVMDTLDEAVGPDNWQRDHRLGEGGKVSCGIGIRVDGVWIWKWDGAGETDIEGEKGSYSDSFKRAGVNWGIARDLYGKDAPPAGQQYGVAVPTQAPRPPMRVAAPDTDLSADEVYGDPRGDDGGVCPDHGLSWALRPGGTSKKTGKPYDPFYACPKSGPPYCQNKPPRSWLARHEVA